MGENQISHHLAPVSEDLERNALVSIQVDNDIRVNFNNETSSRQSNINRFEQRNEGQSSHQSTDEQPWTCVICQETETRSVEEQIRLTCSHEFHKQCICGMIKSSLKPDADQTTFKCPLCRQEFPCSV